MALTFSRDALLAAIDQIVADDKRIYHERGAEEKQRHEDALMIWRERHAKVLAADLRKLADRASRGRPVTEEMVNAAVDAKDGYRYSAKRLASSDPVIRPYVEPRSYNALRTLLLAAEPGSTISQSSLERAGFRNLLSLLDR